MTSVSTVAVKQEDCVAPGDSAPPFDEERYKALCNHYLEPKDRPNEAVGGGMQLRHQRRVCDLERYGKRSPGRMALLKRIRELQRRKDRSEIYRLLDSLAIFEEKACPVLGGTQDLSLDLQLELRSKMPASKRRRIDDDDDIVVRGAATIDLTDDKEAEVIDVEKYIVEVLLLKVVKPDPEALPPSLSGTDFSAAVKQEQPESAASDLMGNDTNIRPGESFNGEDAHGEASDDSRAAEPFADKAQAAAFLEKQLGWQLPPRRFCLYFRYNHFHDDVTEYIRASYGLSPQDLELNKVSDFVDLVINFALTIASNGDMEPRSRHLTEENFQCALGYWAISEMSSQSDMPEWCLDDNSSSDDEDYNEDDGAEDSDSEDDGTEKLDNKDDEMEEDESNAGDAWDNDNKLEDYFRELQSVVARDAKLLTPTACSALALVFPERGSDTNISEIFGNVPRQTGVTVFDELCILPESMQVIDPFEVMLIVGEKFQSYRACITCSIKSYRLMSVAISAFISREIKATGD